MPKKEIKEKFNNYSEGELNPQIKPSKLNEIIRLLIESKIGLNILKAVIKNHSKKARE